MDLIKPDLGLLFWTGLVFCLLLFILAKFAWKPILNAVNARGQKIQEALDLAEKTIRLSGFEPHKEIKIEFTGLRPGEKMYEEILVDYDKATKTRNDKIFLKNTHYLILNLKQFAQ